MSAVPSTWLSVVFFILLVAPGLLFELLSERRRGGFKESAFREISRVVLASLGFSGLALGVLAIIRAVQPSWMPDPGMLFSTPAAYVAGHYRLVLWALVAEGVLALSAVWVVHLLLVWRYGAPIRRVNTWRQVFRSDCPKSCQPFVRVRLSGGIIYTGAVAAYTIDPEDEGGDLVLGPPIFSKSGDGELKPAPRAYQRVVIPRSAVEVLSVEYRPLGPAAVQGQAAITLVNAADGLPESSPAVGAKPKRRADGVLAAASLFLPVTKESRIVFFNLLVLMVVPTPIFVWPLIALFLAYAGSVKSRRGVLRMAGRVFAWTVALYLATWIFIAATAFLGLLAGNGANFADTYSGNDALNYLFEELLIVAIIWFLLGVPSRAFELELNRCATDGAKNLVIGLVTGVACILTGIFIWLLHYSVLSTVSTKQLVAGIIFTIALLGPYYASLARACWQRGLTRVFNPKPLKKCWHQLVVEVQNSGGAEAPRTGDEGAPRAAGARERLSLLDRALRALHLRTQAAQHVGRPDAPAVTNGSGLQERQIDNAD
jgi:hypothetical protein